MDEGNERVIEVRSMFGWERREPLVQIVLGEEEVQLEPGAARHLALNLLQAAEAAYADAFLYSFAMETFDQDEGVAARLIMLVRDWRTANDVDAIGGYDAPIA